MNEREKKLEKIFSKFEKIDVPILEKRRSLCKDSEQNPLISINIPTYNRSGTLRRAIDSVFKQTYQNFEIIVIGDCCTDDTEEVMDKIRDERVLFYNLSQNGPYPKNYWHRWMVAATFPANMALEVSGGKWIAFLNDDDVFMPKHLELLLRHAQKNNLEFVFGRSKQEKSPGKFPKKTGTLMPSGRYPFCKGNVPHMSTLYRSYLNFFDYFIKAWKYEIPIDKFMWMRMHRAGVRIGFLNKVVSLHLLGDENNIKYHNKVDRDKNKIRNKRGQNV